MKIHILGAEKAKQHIPKKRIYAIRIFSGNRIGDCDYGKLVNSPNYIQIKEYYFDDIDLKPGEEEFKEEKGEDNYLLNDRIAKQMLGDFRDNLNSIEELLIHCREGKSRSPATALAFNKIFNLGNNHEELRKAYPSYNKFVYRTLMIAGADFK